MIKKIFKLVLITLITLGCNSSPTEPGTTENKMYVYSNFGNTFYLVDYKTFEVVKEIKLNATDTISINGMILSTNRDYLFFKAEGQFSVIFNSYLRTEDLRASINWLNN